QRANQLAEDRRSALSDRETALASARVAELNARSEAARTRHLLYTVDMNLAPREWETNNIEMLQRLLAATAQNRDRGFEWGYWQRLCHLALTTFRGHLGAVTAVAFDPKANRI